MAPSEIKSGYSEEDNSSCAIDSRWFRGAMIMLVSGIAGSIPAEHVDRLAIMLKDGV